MLRFILLMCALTSVCQAQNMVPIDWPSRTVKAGSADESLAAAGYVKIQVDGGWFWGKPGTRAETWAEAKERFRREDKARGVVVPEGHYEAVWARSAAAVVSQPTMDCPADSQTRFESAGRPSRAPTPATPQTQPPPSAPPLSSIRGPEGQPGKDGQDGKDGKDADDEAILIALLKTVKEELKKPEYKGPKGDPGEFDYEKMPLFVMQYTDKDGQVVEEVPFQFNKAANRFEAKIVPIPVQNFDANSKLIDEEKYPYGTPIKLRHGAKVPATTGPAT